jgi:hypothetical protein
MVANLIKTSCREPKASAQMAGPTSVVNSDRV